MKNKVLEAVVNQAVYILNHNYGYVGVADSDDMVIITSGDEENKILIKITNKKVRL